MKKSANSDNSNGNKWSSFETTVIKHIVCYNCVPEYVLWVEVKKPIWVYFLLQ
jgi:hypothetical protein